MTRKSAKPPRKPRNAVQVRTQDPAEFDDAVAQTLTRPEVTAAAVIQQFQGENHEVNALIRELSVQVEAGQRGDMRRAEAMLIAQSHTLDELFNNLARRAHSNMGGGFLDAADRYLRLALKAQSQCRTTLETLAEIKNPRTVAFVRQANIANGPQQVNNGQGATRAGESEILPSKLLEVQHGERLDIATSRTASGTDCEMATVGEINRTENK